MSKASRAAKSKGARPERGRRTPPAEAQRATPGVVPRWLSRIDNHPYRAALLLGLVHLVLAALSFVPAPHPGGDNAVYLSLAHSLMRGEYRDLYDPLQAVHRQWPPGWPIMMAGAVLTGLPEMLGPKILVALFSATGVALSYLWFRRRGQPGMALIVALALAVSPGVLALSHWELSDVPFWALTTAAFLLWTGLPREDNKRTIGAAVFSIAAYLTRSAGLPLLLAVAGWLLLERRWRQLGIFAAIVIPPSAAWGLFSGGQAEYVNVIWQADAYRPEQGTITLGGMIDRIGVNIQSYVNEYIPILLSGAYPRAIVVLSAILCLLAIYGWARLLRLPSAAELWLPIYIGLLLIWNPEWAGDRFILPVYPLLLLYAGTAISSLSHRLPGVVRAVPGAVSVALVFLLATPGVAAAVKNGNRCTRGYFNGDPVACLDAAWHDFYEIAGTAPTLIPEGSVVLSRKPAFFWAVSGFPGRVYPFTDDPDEFFAAAREIGARYVVLDKIDSVATMYLAPILLRRPAAFCIVNSLGVSRATLLGILPDGESIPDLEANRDLSEADVAFNTCGPEYFRP